MPSESGFGDDIKLALASLKDIDKQLGAALPGMTEDGADLVTASAIRNVRAASGETKASIVTKVVDDDGSDGDAAHSAAVGHFVGRFLEHGTKLRVSKKTGKRSGSMPRTPFLAPAAERNRARIRNLISERVEAIIGRALRIRSRRRK